MNDQLEQALLDLINKSLSGIDTATNFLSAEIPEVIGQLLIWHGLYNFILFCMSILLIVGIITGNLYQIRWYKKRKASDKNFDDDVLLFNLLQLFFVFPLIVWCNLTWLQIWITPKVWLLEYATNMVK